MVRGMAAERIVEPAAEISAPAHPPLDGVALLEHAIKHAFRDRIAVVSSFGAESAILLALVADIDPATPVLFVDTGQHFPETLANRRRLSEALGLRDVRDVRPTEQALRDNDPEGQLWQFDTDACCALRKVAPLEQALAPFQAWVTGRKRHQASTRQTLPFFELADCRVKINPLADWTAERIEAEMLRRGLPRHELSLRGYPSIGCAVCTQRVDAGQDPRSGRWAGSTKTECGIHKPAAKG